MNKSTIVKLIIAIIVVACVLCGALFVLNNRVKENLTEISYDSVESIPDGEAFLIVDGTVSDERVRIFDDKLYLSYDFVYDTINSSFYLDEAEGFMFYTTPDAVNRFTVNEKTYLENDVEKTSDLTVIRNESGKYYISVDFVKNCSNGTYSYYENPRRLMISLVQKESLFYTTLDETPFHSQPDITSEITAKLPADTKLSHTAGFGKKKKEFLKVMTEDGRYGYVQIKHLSDSFYEMRTVDTYELKENHILMDEKVKLGWHQISGKVGNDTYSSVTKNVNGMNVISPTWFRLADENGGIASIGDEKYVERAHKDGYKVWVLVDNFDNNIGTTDTLLSTFKRTNLINNIVAETVKLGADGVNIDFEALRSEGGVHFVEFIKELSVKCHRNNLILSVDNYVPTEYRKYYGIEEQGKYADYIIIMAYDEHYAGSPEAGSVSSIGFFRKAIDDTIKMVDRKQIICAVPFYTRLWKETPSGLTSVAYSIEGGKKAVSDNNANVSWDAECGQYYSEYKIGEATYKIWLEEENSLKLKLESIASNGIGGMAGWRLGLEEDTTWNLINTYIK